jgi:phosphoglycolate phosphatase
MLDHTRPYPGVEDALATLSQRGMPLAVLSNKPDEMTRAMVRSLFPGVSFGAVWGQRPERPKKPDPAVAIQVAEQLGVPPPRCALVGDTSVDMRTAVRASMVAVGVLWGFRSREELTAHGAQVLLDRPQQLAALGSGAQR